jgi:hypothetical protein
MTNPERRLTSWKAIATYLGREVRTVTRWEKERGLPVHRGPGGKSGVVFADMDELDAWTRGETAAPESDPPPDLPVTAAIRPVLTRRRAAALAFSLLAVAVALTGWRVRASKANERPGSAVMTDAAVIARNADGSEKWRYDFTGDRAYPAARHGTPQGEPLGKDGVLMATLIMERRDTMVNRSGQLLWFDPVGTVRQTFSFEDDLQIGSRPYAAPWALSDYRVNDDNATRRIAVSAHHHVWWPSIVTILDDHWQRNGSFVHAGWVESMRWLPGNRLAIAGFSNLRDGGMVALLDGNAIDGQSPVPRGSEFDCAGCGPNRPVRYVVLPRSEVNRVSAAPFNRAELDVRAGSRLEVSTMELPYKHGPATALYEFTQQLDLVSARYSDRYWQDHLELEKLGKITHSREQCPERDGPPSIEIWEPATGWRIQPIRR